MLCWKAGGAIDHVIDLLFVYEIVDHVIEKNGFGITMTVCHVLIGSADR